MENERQARYMCLNLKRRRDVESIKEIEVEAEAAEVVHCTFYLDLS